MQKPVASLQEAYAAFCGDLEHVAGVPYPKVKDMMAGVVSTNGSSSGSGGAGGMWGGKEDGGSKAWGGWDKGRETVEKLMVGA